MADSFYREYVTDEAFQKSYSEYQAKYATTVRESDRVLIEIVRELREVSLRRVRVPALLDIGCSTGNFLLHVKRLIPQITLTGGDMVPTILDQCRRNPDLAGISFNEMNIVDLQMEATYDIVVANAVLTLLGEDDFRLAARSVAHALKPQGWFVVFDYFHPFEQALTILEKSITHPNGVQLHFRPYQRVQDALTSAGFGTASFKPFRIPIDLPRPMDSSNLGSYTRITVDGERLLFRGALFQPWCHLFAQKQ